ncbi:16S rRNA (guanine(527)-N(7))-methyltransferase RsmG [Paenibacillus sp. S-12]|uniref:16S rRNA (guanine(527)-N(7))-methyltransferase RsmG n=1 Tax=unclassified Paenibacillus TaxID=185978 RepID=UPI0025A1F1CC|nr:16S rRNA (guanine(527)-N(7))-methyltransferase RsmG [Paenibacillus sp. S-12]
MDALQEQFQGWLSGHGWPPVTDIQWNQLDTYYRVLVEWNEKMNLTGITERELVYEKHFYDSLTLGFHVDMMSVKRMADIGSGAGFPGIPLVIMFPHIKLTIVDSLNKRIVFLNHLVQELGLTGVSCIHGRAEEVARKPEHRDQYDLVTARAVARLNVLNEFCLPFVRPGGTFAAMKGTNPQEEIVEAKRSLQVLQATFTADYALKLPVEQSERHIVVMTKKGTTPKAYPRKPGTPLKTPLV